MNKTYLAFTVFVALLACFALSGCSGMSVENDLQKYNQLKASLPDNICLIECESREEYPEEIQQYQAYAQLNFMPGKHAIYTLKGNYCLLAHEYRHTTHGAGHKDWPLWLMKCNDDVEMG